ncbi:hypothetical protein LTS18_006650, partial [Coniosporium uncinatum]
MAFQKPTNPIPSSSPAFGTPVHPIPPKKTLPIPFHVPSKPTGPAPVLRIDLPSATLRPLAFRTFTKKHNLTLHSTGLARLSNFVGLNCGSGWREEGLAEGVLEEVARAWKKAGGAVIVEKGELLDSILKSIEGSMSGGKVQAGKGLQRSGSGFVFGGESESQESGPDGRSTLRSDSSFGMSNLEVNEEEEEEDKLKDPREWVKVVNAFEQPRLTYNVQKKHFEKNSTKPSLFPSINHRTALFRQRYNLTHHRILRNPSFAPTSFSSTAPTSSNRLTPIANLLGRSGSTHLLLGLLLILPTGTLALADLTGSISLDLSQCTQIPTNAAYFCPGMIVLLDGVYEEDYSTSASNLGTSGGIGGTIGGKFIGSVIGHPPCERRTTTLGISEAVKPEPGSATAGGPAFGWTDFLGLGSERAVGGRMRKLQTRLYAEESPHHGNRHIAIAAECTLDKPEVLGSIKALLQSYAKRPLGEYPLAIVFMGNFVCQAAMSGAGASADDVEEGFNELAKLLAEFKELIGRTTLVFVPGDNDTWASSFSAGAATVLPRGSVPEMFTRKIKQAMSDANRELGTRGGRKVGEVVWASNPTRLGWFGGTGEMVCIRDDISSRFRRNAIRLKDGPDVQQDDNARESERRRTGRE